MNHIIHDAIAQGTPEWHKLRCGKVTASELKNILTDKFKIRTGDTPKSYLYLKAAESWIGRPVAGFTSWAMDQGTIREEEARPWYEMIYNTDVAQVGFVEAEGENFGASPDGLIGDNSGLEIKCPEPKAHVRYLAEGVLPDEYAAQVHGCMYATGRPEWVFMSYHRDFPKFVITVKRDERIMEIIGQALAGFNGELLAMREKLEELALSQGVERPELEP